METDESDVLKETAEAMYASTGDTIWLAFKYKIQALYIVSMSRVQNCLSTSSIDISSST
jgi:hypothetical protein